MLYIFDNKKPLILKKPELQDFLGTRGLDSRGATPLKPALKIKKLV